MESVALSTRDRQRRKQDKKIKKYFDSNVFQNCNFFSANSGIGSGSDSKRFVHTPLKSTKMNKDRVPYVTTLLRASRSQDEDTLRQVLENILRNGISEAELNAEDCSGRVSE